MNPKRRSLHQRLSMAVAVALAAPLSFAASTPPPPSDEAIVLYARIAPGVTLEGLSPWSRDFSRQATINPDLRARLSNPARIEAINSSFAGFSQAASAAQPLRSGESAPELRLPVFRPYRWVRLIWPAGAESAVLAERLRQTRLFEHVEGEPLARERSVTFHQSATITDPLVTSTNVDPHRWQWAIAQAGFPGAFGFTEGRVLVGVVDQGINPSHPDLLAAQRPHQRAALVRYTLPQADDGKKAGAEIGFFPQPNQLNADLGGQLPQYASNVGHGLHVAGLIAAGKNNGEGGVGGCPGCGLSVLRFIDVSLLETAWQAQGLSFGSSAISMSFSMPYMSQLQLDTLQALDARDVVLVASLGNSARKISLQSQNASAFPGYLPFVIGVGGTDSAGERWHEHTVAHRPLIRRHPQLWREAVIDGPFCGLRMSGLGLPWPNEQLLPVDSSRTECGSNWGRSNRTAPFDVGYTWIGTTTFPAGQYDLDLMAPAAQVLAPLDRTYSRYLTDYPLWPNAVLRPFPCWFAPGPLCEWTLPGQNSAPNTNFIANTGVAMGGNEIDADFREIPRNETSLAYAQYGTMTGTSMAAPLVAAAVGLMRSANPLLRAAAVHDTLRCTATTMTDSEVWSGSATQNPNPIINATIRTQLTGSGRLNAEAAVRRVMGTVGGQTLRNRLIPMFSLGTYSGQTARGWLYTTSPQVAMSGMTGDLHRLVDSANSGNTEVNEDPDGPGPLPFYTGNPLPLSLANDVGAAGAVWYSAGFVEGVGAQIPANSYTLPGNWIHLGDWAPAASFFVLSTPYNTLTATADGLAPLYRMSAKCNQYRKHFYTTSTSERASALAGPANCAYSSSLAFQGFDDEGIEGFVYPATQPQPSGTIALYRHWLPSTQSWVLVTEHETGLAAYAGATLSTQLGWVYPAVEYKPTGTTFLDTDNDGLPDAFEALVGLSKTNSDTDGDGRGDGVELPFAGPGASDPLVSDLVTPCVP